MLWMVAAQIVPEALVTTSRRAVALALAGSTAAMLTLEALLLTWTGPSSREVTLKFAGDCGPVGLRISSKF